MSDSQPLDYGHASPRRRGGRWMVVIGILAILLVLFLVLETDSFSLGRLFGSRPSPIVLPGDPWLVTIPVGGRVKLPGGRGTPVMSIPSISNGQAMLVTDWGNGGGSGFLAPGEGGGDSFGTQSIYYRLKGIAGNQVTLELSLRRLPPDAVMMSPASTQP